eukprot:9235408-Alexandrium_andersonii.AAC.1
MAGADERISEHLAQRVQANAEAGAGPFPQSAVGAGAASSVGSRPGQEEPRGRLEPAFAGGGSAGSEARALDTNDPMSDIGEQEMPEANAEDVDEEMGLLINLAQEAGGRSQEGSEGLRLRAAPDLCDAWTSHALCSQQQQRPGR